MPTHSHIGFPCIICGYPLRGKEAIDYIESRRIKGHIISNNAESFIDGAQIMDEAQIFEILQKIQNNEISLEDAQKQLLDLFYVMRCSIVKHPIGEDDKENRKVTYCYHCGTNVRGQKYCHMCGYKLLWGNI